jgi:exodeoxyribonuclease V gamma subunit
VLGLLQQAPVARRFGLDADDLALARQALMDAGAHWGLDAAHRARLGLPGDARHTLDDALERLVLGHVMPDGAPPFDGRAPAGALTGSDGRVLGALDALAQRLAAWAARLAVPHPAAQWPPLLAALLDDFARADADATEDARELHEALTLLAARLDTAGVHDEPLPLAVVRLALQQALDDPARGGVAGGAVTFTSMNALRQVPMRVIAVLGLNDTAFPSPDRPAEWDLMRHDPRIGDRQRRHDERNLFLDLLLAAGDVLHLSHTGRSQRDNTDLPPSVLVAELLEHLGESLAPDADAARLTVHHPLQPFSDTLFDPAADPRLHSFHTEYAQALRARAEAPRAVAASADGDDTVDGDSTDDGEDDTDDDTALPAGPSAPFFTRPLAPADAAGPLTLDDLTRFVRHPARALLRDRLRVDLPWDEPLPEDDEPLVPEHAQRRALTQQVLPALLKGAPRDTAVALARAATDWPTGPLGDAALAGALDDLQAFADRVAPLLADTVLAPVSGSVTVPVDGTPATLHIVLADLRPGGRVAHRSGRVRPADLLAQWVSHLALCALAPAGVACRTVLVTDEATHTFAPVDAPLPLLGALATLRRRGLAEPLPLLPKAAWALGDTLDNLVAARQAFQPTERTPFAEGGDAAWQLVLRGHPDPLADVPGGFVDLARAVWGPLRAALQVQPA